MSRPSTGAFVKRVFIVVGILTLTVVLLLFLWSTRRVLLLTFLGVLLAVFWRTLSEPLSRHTPLSEVWAVVIVVFLLSVCSLLLGWFFAPRLTAQIRQFEAAVSPTVQQLEETLQNVPFGRRLLSALPTFEEMPEELPLSNLMSRLSELVGSLFGTLSGLAQVTTDLVFLFFVALFFALRPDFYRRGVVKLVPKGGRKRADEVLGEAGSTLRSWLIGRFLAMLSVGVMVTLGLWLLGVPLALLLGFLAFLLDFVPFIGPFVSLLPAALVAFTQSPLTVLWVALLYLAAQQIEGYVVTPLVQQRAVHLPAVLTLAAVFVFGNLFGLLGLLAATPLAAVLLVVVKLLYLEDALGEAVEV